jgi:hypothetical protein
LNKHAWSPDEVWGILFITYLVSLKCMFFMINNSANHCHTKRVGMRL